MEKPSLDTAKAGAIRFNTDSSQLEIYDGNQWTGILGDSPELQIGGTRGFQAGGQTSDIEFVNIDTTGNTQDFGSLSTNNSGYAVASSRTRTLFAGYYSGNNDYNTIEFITVSSLGNATNFGDMTITRGRLTGGASSTRALFAGQGRDPATVSNVIDFVTISTTGDAVDFGDLTVARSRMGAFGSPTRLCVAGGYAYPAYVDTIDYVTISTQGNAADFGNLLGNHGWNASACNAVRGFSMGASPNSSIIEFVTTATLGNSQDFGDLTAEVRGGYGASSKTRAVNIAGYNESSNYKATTDYFQIMTTGNAKEFGDAPGRAFGTSGVASNGHGGL